MQRNITFSVRLYMTLVSASAMTLVLRLSFVRSTWGLPDTESTDINQTNQWAAREGTSRQGDRERAPIITHPAVASPAPSREDDTDRMSMMEWRAGLRWLSRWDRVKEGRRRMPKRSCSHARVSSARFIFLWTIENFRSGCWWAAT